MGKRQYTCEVCGKRSVWDKATWRWIYAPSCVQDGPICFCCDACEDAWFEAGDWECV